MVGGRCSHETNGASLRGLEDRNASSVQDHGARLDPLPVTRRIEHRHRHPVATVEVRPLDAAVGQEAEAIRVPHLDPAGARKLIVLRGAEQGSAAIGIVISCRRECRTASQREGDEENRQPLRKTPRISRLSALGSGVVSDKIGVSACLSLPRRT